MSNVRVVNNLSNERVHNYVSEIFSSQMHEKRVWSLANAAIGLLNSEELLLHKMGAGLAKARTLNKKHATKQIDRLLSNKKFDIWTQTDPWVAHVIGKRKDIMVAMDWTDFDADNQAMLTVNLITNHGRATPLLWKTVDKSSLKHNRARYEDQILSKLKEAIGPDIKVTVLADRGFADQKFFKFIDEELGFLYIIRIRGGIYIKDKNSVSKPAKEWLRTDGRTYGLSNVKATQDECSVARFVATKQQGMKDAWYLLSNCKDLAGSTIVKYYGKRWGIECFFRDVKDHRFGMGLINTHIKDPTRRDRLFFILAISIFLLTVLGAAGESLGFDKKLKVNTVKTRTHSLLTQGIFYYDFFYNFSQEEQTKLMGAFNELLHQQAIWQKLLFMV